MMLKSISWSDYFSSLLFLLVTYYIAIGYLYFRNELLRLAGITRPQIDTISAISIDSLGEMKQPTIDERTQSNLSGNIDISPVVQAFIAEVEAYMQQAVAEKTVKQEILFALQRISARYPVLADSEYKTALAKDIYNLSNRCLPGMFSLTELESFVFT